MSIFREIPPTAGFPLSLNELALPKKGSLEHDFKDYLGVDAVWVTYSGTAALYLILESLKIISDKTTVIIPSYVCPLVPLAIKRAGLKVEVCDIQPDRFDFNLNELEKICARNKDILAIITVHLAGIPLDFDPIQAIAKKYNIFTIEDCAQSLGAVYKGKKTGTLGDFSFFSLCRGKGLTIYEGGIITASNPDYAKIIDERIRLLVKPDFLSETVKILELFGYWIFYRPSLFWFIFSLPQIFWNLMGNKERGAIEYFSENFSIYRVSNIRKSVAHNSFQRIDKEIQKQREKARFYFDGLKEAEGLTAVKELPGTTANYPYVTLIFDNPKKRDMVLRLFRNSGLGISQIYLYAICDYDYLKPFIPQRNCANGRYLAERELTLSTSAFLKKEDLERILHLFESL